MDKPRKQVKPRLGGVHIVGPATNKPTSKPKQNDKKEVKS